MCCSYDTIISLLIVACERLVYVNCFYVLWHKLIVSHLHTVVSLLTVACERLVHLVYANCFYVLQCQLISIISHNHTVILLLVACKRLVYPVSTNNCHNVQPFRIACSFQNSVLIVYMWDTDTSRYFKKVEAKGLQLLHVHTIPPCCVIVYKRPKSQCAPCQKSLLWNVSVFCFRALAVLSHLQQVSFLSDRFTRSKEGGKLYTHTDF